MCSAVIALSLLAAVDPVRIGITALLITRPRPMPNLLAFWLGGMVAGISAALAILLFLRGWTLSLMRVVVSSTSSPIAAYIQVAVGVLAVSFGAVLLARSWAHQRPPVPVTAGESSVLLLEPRTPPAARRPSIRGRLASGSLLVAFVAGVALATPPVEYMAAMLAIVASEPAATAQLGAALFFTVVAFTVVEVPLITYLTAPDQTLAVVRKLNDWISARGHAIPAVVVAVLGVSLLANGMGRV
jgi:Sap-like sulfolipid-1-addressing protein